MVVPDTFRCTLRRDYLVKHARTVLYIMSRSKCCELSMRPLKKQVLMASSRWARHTYLLFGTTFIRMTTKITTISL
jgi:hypothetical protein